MHRFKFVIEFKYFFILGVLGIKVKIMLPWDPTGKTGPKKPLPDHVSIVEPKDEVLPTGPTSEQVGGKPDVAAAAQQQQQQQQPQQPQQPQAPPVV